MGGEMGDNMEKRGRKKKAFYSSHAPLTTYGVCVCVCACLPKVL